VYLVDTIKQLSDYRLQGDDTNKPDAID